MPPLKRRAESSDSDYSRLPNPHSRRHRPALQAVDLTRPTQPAPEIIDLSSDSDTEVLAESGDTGAGDRQGEVIRQAANEEGDPRLSHFQCVICLDDPTDLTATRCGHLFCHMCITQALRASQGTARMAGTANGACPVCRKSVTAKSLLPLSILKGVRPPEDVSQ